MKSVKEYMDLPYNFIIQPIKDESASYFYARILELNKIPINLSNEGDLSINYTIN